MKNRLYAESGLAKTLLASFAWLALLPAAALAQVPVDEDGKIIGNYEKPYSEPTTGNEDIPLLSTAELEELVGPIALYPDDLLAIVLPAAAYPLQIVDAARFLDALEDDPSLKPDPEWDDSVVALLNYPEVIELLNDDIDWTWRLGEAVVSQQPDVIGAIETFRDRAYAAGNLKSDSYQNVSQNDGIIEITPVAEDVIYVPYYEPERVVVYQPRPVYYYYPRPYPVYYYPYSSAYVFDRGYFWGVTTAFTIGWYSNNLSVFHHSYLGHPYYGRTYWDRWWYRRPTRVIHHTNYVGRNTNITVNRYYGGDRWRPRNNRRDYVPMHRVTRNREYPSPRPESDRKRISRTDITEPRVRTNVRRRDEAREPISFRERPQTPATTRNPGSDKNRVSRTGSTEPRVRTNVRRRDEAQEPISFRERPRNTATSRNSGNESNRQTTRVTPRNKETAVRTRTDATRRQLQQRRAEPAVPARRQEPTRQTGRTVAAAPAPRRVEPQRQVRQAAPPRRESAPRQKPAAAEPRQSSKQKSERRSSSERKSPPRRAERRR